MAITINKNVLPIISKWDLPNLDYVHTKYLSENPDIDSMKTETGVYGLYNCSQAPSMGIGVLEVLVYTSDWVIQRFTEISATPKMWERAFYSGTTWGSWIQRW